MVFLLLLVFILFYGAGDGIQGLVNAKQELYTELQPQLHV
jgi:hypothetical protein